MPSSGLLRNLSARAARETLRLQRFPHDLSPGGVYRAAFVSKCAVRSYRTVSPFPFGVSDTRGDSTESQVSAKRWFIFCDTILQVALTGR